MKKLLAIVTASALFFTSLCTFGAETALSGDVNGDGAIDNRDVTGASKLASTFVHPHSWGEWTTITEPTCVADGTQERICSCDEREETSIPATGTYLRSCL